MKTRLAMALSVAGVLAAGSAAALANTQILDGGDTASGASAAVLPAADPVDLTIPAPPPPTSAPATTTSSTSVPAPTTTRPSEEAATTSEHLTTFNVGAAGSVTLDVIAGRLRLVDVVAGDGWTVVVEEEHRDDNEVEVEFRSQTAAVEFEARLVDGEIVPDVSQRSLVPRTTAATTPAPSAVPTVSFDDDHGDDSFGDDDHDDDHDDGGFEDDDHDDDHDDDGFEDDDHDDDGSDDHGSDGSDEHEDDDRDDD